MQEFIKTQASKTSLSTRRLIQGVGVNDAWYATWYKVNGKEVRCPVYTKWRSMLVRCYNKDYQEKYPTYKGCKVCCDWLTFSNFAEWYNDNYTEGWYLDKDIKLNGNKIYSPTTCMFVPCCINNLMLSSSDKAGKYPIGVSLHKPTGEYKAQISIDNKKVSLGYFKKPECAHEAYVTAKNTEIMRKCQQYPSLAKHIMNHML